MAITAAMVKELRETTGAGMMDAKKALTETDGDFEAAIDWLRTKGLAKAAKKSDRVAAEGLVAVAVDGGKGVAVEINSETDFVAKNADFQAMVASFAKAGLGVNSVEELADASVDGKSVSDILTDKIATIGEMVALKGSNPEFGRQVAMHIAAVNPAALNADELDAAYVEREKAILVDQARESGKPEAVIEKMIEGRMKKFLGEVTLLCQSFVINPDLTVEQAAKEAGVEITGFVRLAVGEGIEKKEEDFAAEVAKAAQG